MKIYAGIKATNQSFYIAALDSQGRAVLKNQFPITAPYNTIANALTSLKSAFNAKLVISIGMDDYIKASFAKVIRKRFDNVQLVNSSLLYTTDLIAEDRVDYTLYRDSLHLAIIGSLAD